MWPITGPEEKPSRTCEDDYSRWNHAILNALEASEALEALGPHMH